METILDLEELRARLGVLDAGVETYWLRRYTFSAVSLLNRDYPEALLTAYIH